jgi:hypothetical protein
MERRQQPRTAINVVASLNYPPLGLVQTRLRDISYDGAYAHLGAIRLNLYSTVEIIDCINHQLTSLRAQVVRVSPQGVGLQFEESNPALIQRLHCSNREPDSANDATPARHK